MLLWPSRPCSAVCAAARLAAASACAALAGAHPATAGELAGLLRTAVVGGSESADTPETVAALADSTVRFDNGPATATSSLDPTQALHLARLICAVTPRTSCGYVLPTGSMTPLFGDKVILLLENAPFGSLRPGDIVTYRHPRLGRLIVHRLVAGDGLRFRAKGDGNASQDDVYVTRANYRQRVFGMIYTR